MQVQQRDRRFRQRRRSGRIPGGVRIAAATVTVSPTVSSPLITRFTVVRSCRASPGRFIVGSNVLQSRFGDGESCRIGFATTRSDLRADAVASNRHCRL